MNLLPTLTALCLLAFLLFRSFSLSRQVASLESQLNRIKCEAVEAQVDPESRQSPFSDKAKSSFLALITHELKTPLNVISGFASLMLADQKIQGSEKLSRQVRNIQTGSEHMLTIVSRLLDFEKIERSQLELSIDQLDIVELIADTVQFLKPLADQRRIQIRIESKDYSKMIDCDGSRVRQILINLITNSLKFSPEGDVVSVEIKEANDFVQFCVADHGSGLSDENKEKVFEKYVQIGTEEDRSKGNGLGLAISRELVLLHGGRIWAESEGIGQGCAFFCELPIVQPHGLALKSKVA